MKRSYLGFSAISRGTHGGNGLKNCMLIYPSELIRLGSWSVDLSNFGAILTLWNGSNLGFPGISWWTLRGNGLPFCMLMYLVHLQNWLDYGHSLLIFLILALFWLREMLQIWGFWSCSVDFPHYGTPLTQTGHIRGFWALSGEHVVVNVETGAGAYFRRFASSSVLLVIELCFICEKFMIMVHYFNGEIKG